MKDGNTSIHLAYRESKRSRGRVATVMRTEKSFIPGQLGARPFYRFFGTVTLYQPVAYFAVGSRHIPRYLGAENACIYDWNSLIVPVTAAQAKDDRLWLVAPRNVLVHSCISVYQDTIPNIFLSCTSIWSGGEAVFSSQYYASRRSHCMSSFGTIPWYGNFEKYGMYHTF